MMNRHVRRAAIASLVSAGLIVPAQAKLWVPHKPAIIKPEKDWQNLLAGPLTLGTIAARNAPLAFGYRNKYSDTSNTSTYTIPSVDFGPVDPTRVVVVGAVVLGATTTSANIGGVAGTVVVYAIDRGSIFSANVPTGLTGTVVIRTLDDTPAHGDPTPHPGTACIIYVWSGYPVNPVRGAYAGVAVNANTIGTTPALAKTIGGFTCFITYALLSTATVVLTQTGPETITEHDDGVLDATSRTGAMSHINTATTTTNTYKGTFSASTNISVLGATWA